MNIPMKNFVKIIAAVAAGVFLTLDISAKNGVEVGYLNSSYRTKLNSGDISKSTPMSGFYAGLVKDMDIVAGLSLQSGLYYSYLNNTGREEVLGFNITESATEHMLNIPIQFKYTFDIIPAFGVYIFAGPTLSLGVAAPYKLSATGDVLGNKVDGSVTFDCYSGKVRTNNLSDENVESINELLPDYSMNRFDVLMGGGIGIDLVKFVTIKGGFDYGLLNRYKGDLADAGTLNRMQFYVSVGLMF